MKSFFIYLLSAIILVTTSCSPQENPNDNPNNQPGGGNNQPSDKPQENIYISLDQEEVILDPEGGSADVEVYSNHEWKISGTSDWCTPSIKSGEANEDGQTVTFSADVSYDNREAVFWFRCADEKVKFVVKQNRKEVFIVNGDTSFNIPYEGGSAKINYQTSVECEIAIPQDAKSWVSIANNMRGLTSNDITLQIHPNTGKQRSAKIELKSVDNKFKQTYIITQDAAPLKVNIADNIEGKKIINIANCGDTQSFSVTGPDWKVSSSASWVQVYKDDNNQEFVISVAAHYAKARSAEVIVQSVDGKESITITVNQEEGSMPENALTFKPNAAFPELIGDSRGVLQLTEKKGTYHLEVVLADTEQFVWYVVIDNSIDWISSAQTTPHKKKYNLYLNVEPNTMIEEELPHTRTAVIYVVCEYRQDDIVENSVKYELTIKQSSANRNEDPYVDPTEKWE